MADNATPPGDGATPPETQAPPDTPAQATLPIVPAPPAETPPAPAPSEDTPDEVAELKKQLEEQGKLLAQLTEDRTTREAREKAEREAQEEAKAKEEGKLPELLEQRTKALEEAQKALDQKTIDSALLIAAQQAGIGDPAYVRMARRDEVKIADGVVTGATEAVAALKEAFPALFTAAPEGGVVQKNQTEQEALAGGPAKPTAPQQIELSDAQKEFLSNSGWEQFNGRYTHPRTGQTVTFGDVWTGGIKENLFYRPRGE